MSSYAPHGKTISEVYAKDILSCDSAILAYHQFAPRSNGPTTALIQLMRAIPQLP